MEGPICDIHALPAGVLAGFREASDLRLS